ncbi:bifunctional nicotinamidase/pyrazinamidase [Lichenicoccus sp.]|uniref:bifunctional nicotinamidase/pyrazinamidase n=1 Tax=Lichenicoccus sp. TaxID=2781899 RepID=UPI003D10DD3D
MLQIDQATDMLAVIDVQPTFMPGGELPVVGGDEIVPVINHLLCNRFRSAFATQDWHPRGHLSFASAHPGAAPFDVVAMPYGPQVLWPDHAIQGSLNAALHPGLHQDRLQMILRKGCNRSIDSYSAFSENDRATSTGLAEWLRARGVRRLFFCGLATDYCVAWSAEDAVASGFEAVVLEDACRGIGSPGPDGRDSLTVGRQRMIAAGVALQDTTALG